MISSKSEIFATFVLKESSEPHKVRNFVIVHEVLDFRSFPASKPYFVPTHVEQVRVKEREHVGIQNTQNFVDFGIGRIELSTRWLEGTKAQQGWTNGKVSSNWREIQRTSHLPALLVPGFLIDAECKSSVSIGLVSPLPSIPYMGRDVNFRNDLDPSQPRILDEVLDVGRVINFLLGICPVVGHLGEGG